MVFGHPEVLILILPLTLAVFFVALYARSRRHRAALAFADAAMGARIMPAESGERFWGKLALWEAALLFSLLALARPQWGELVEEVKIKGSDLYVLIDVSRSMLATDVKPSRLGRAKADVSGLLDRLKGERVGLIAFAGRAAVKCPLTSDYSYVRTALAELGPNSVDRGGTAIGDAIRVALNVLPPVADRDQAILLITDGDDQDSDPEHAAALASERHITIFTVGLGDPEEGAKVPEKEGGTTFLKYEGKDVMSKMGDELLGKIAAQTNGAYVRARTSNYDLGQLYDDKLSQLRGDYAREQKRSRMAERFELPLLAAVLCFLCELLLRPYAVGGRSTERKAFAPRSATAATLLLLALLSQAHGADAGRSIDDGMKAYAKKEYAAAGEKFTEAQKDLPREESDAAARATFDAGCAYQRAEDAQKAREAYLQASLARDKNLAASAQFNLGVLESETAKKAAGATPEETAKIPAEKRAEIVEHLKTAAGHYRACLDLQPDYPGARKNLELLRSWIKTWSDRWNAIDRQKRRDELNLLQFLEFLGGTQKTLRSATQSPKENGSADEFADLKRLQDELVEEIDPLKEKVDKEISAPSTGGPPQQPAVDNEHRAEAVKMLKQWADEAREKMKASSEKLGASSPAEAMAEQRAAAETFDRMEDALSPFQMLLARNLRDQTALAEALKPPEKDEAPSSASKPKDEPKKEASTAPTDSNAVPDIQEQNAETAYVQSDTSRRTALMKMKAQKELEELEKKTAENAKNPHPEPKKEKEWLTLEDMKKNEDAKKLLDKEADDILKKAGKPGEKSAENKPPTPEEIKKGLQTAIELAPKAVEKMDAAAGHLRKEERQAAYPDAEEARKLLQQIMDAQPKQHQQEQKDQQKKEQEQKQKEKDQQKKDQDKKDQDKKDQEKKEQDKKDQQKKDQEKQEKDKNGGKDKDEQKKDGKPEKQQLSKEQAEALLRKVRERDMERRKKKADERDAISGRMQGVEKDW